MERKTLLVTAWLLPIKILHWQTAIKMVYEGSVNVLVEYDEEVRSPSVTWKMPAVLQLRRPTPAVKRGVKFSRMNVYQRDRFTCQYCGRKLMWKHLTFDHVVPRCRGGRTDFRNIVTACNPCNAKKDNRSCDEAGMFPLTTPTWPKSLPMASPLVDPSKAPEEWREVLAYATQG